MQKPLRQTWDLDLIFRGGSHSPQFATFLHNVDQDIAAFHEQIERTSPPQSVEEGMALVPLVDVLQGISMKMKEASAYTACLASQDQNDKQAVQLNGTIKTMKAKFASTLTLFDRLLTLIADDTWLSLLEEATLLPIAFSLDERRTLALDKCSSEQESLVHDLAVDGYHGWGDLYNTIVSRMKLTVEEDGQVLQLSAGQAANKLSHPNRAVREPLFQHWEQAWSAQADLCADALNHLGGFRLQLYKHRGWENIHKEPLTMNRMSAQTLQVMWDVIDCNKAPLVAYLQRKAALLGLESLSWHDVEAPLASTVQEVSYDEAAATIIEQFRKFSPKMADFSMMAFEKGWIEAEDRPGKRPGGFCTSFPISEETRIFMTYSGTASNISTLAHELGHAYHQHVMRGLPAMAQNYAMNVAETASTFAEMIVADAVVKQATNDEDRLSLLEDKIQRSVAFFMNIHARFIFESDFYRERQQGLVSVQQLNNLMTAAQKKAYHHTLSEYHPHFWASKLHFYLTDVPFYNFPYTFGYLFSTGIYAEALKTLDQGDRFEEKYIALLRDTGTMTVEDLALKHLGVDLTAADFWQSAVDVAIEDVNQFMQLTETKI